MCKRCGAAKQKKVATPFYINEQLPHARVMFLDNHTLKSLYNSQVVSVKAYDWLTVYMADLNWWIQSNLRGIIFEDINQEAEFLQLYPHISRADYV